MDTLDDIIDELTEEIQADLADDVTVALKSELVKQYTREGVKAQWKNGRPISARHYLYSSKIDSTGRLSRSIKSTPTDDGIEVEMEDYAYIIDQGRKPRGRWPNVGYIQRWIRSKPVHSNLSADTLTFLIGRKIKWFGTKGTNFIEKGLENIKS